MGLLGGGDTGSEGREGSGEVGALEEQVVCRFDGAITEATRVVLGYVESVVMIGTVGVPCSEAEERA